MKTIKRSIFLFLVLISVLSCRILGQQTNQNYGNIPSALVAYDKYQKAYKYHFLVPIEYLGAGREIPIPKDIKEVRIGFLGPLEGSNLLPLGKQMLQGTLLSIEEANNKGGYKGLPYKLMIHNDVGPWGAAANEIVKMDDEKVWGWIGSIDDFVSHVAIRATLKLEIPNVCTGDPDPTFTETNIPWVIRVIPDDRQANYVLVEKIFKTDKHKRVAVIRVNSRYGRVGVLHFTKTATRIGNPVVIEERFLDGETDFSAQIGRVKQTNPDAILMWGNAKECSLILQQLRKAGLNQPVYGSDRLVSNEFLSAVGNLAEGIVTTCQYDPDTKDPKYIEFKNKYMKRFNMEPDAFAAFAYDGTNILVKAIEKAGLNRALIRDRLTDLKTFQNYEGVTGKIVFDQTWNNIRPVFLAEVKNGKFAFSPAPAYK